MTVSLRLNLTMQLTSAGTLITMTRRKIPEVTGPIFSRLDDEHSLLRQSGDVSMLAEALLDVGGCIAARICGGADVISGGSVNGDIEDV